MMLKVRLNPTPKNIDRVTQVQNKWTDRLMKLAGVVDTATGLDGDGKLTVKVFSVNTGVKGLPKSIDGIPVKRVVTGALHARWQSEDPVNPRQRFGRQCEVGGNRNDLVPCSQRGRNRLLAQQQSCHGAYQPCHDR